MQYRATTPDKIQTFTDLTAWKEGHRFVIAIYRESTCFPHSEEFSLTNQLRRAAISITSNIAEGFTRLSVKEKQRFFETALGSLMEIQNQLLIARDVNYLSSDKFDNLAEQSIRIRKLIRGLIKSSPIKILDTQYSIPNTGSNAGASLLEVIVATGLVTTVVTALMLTALFSIRTTLRAHWDTQAAELATAEVELLRHLPVTSLLNQTDGPLIAGAPPALTDLPAGSAVLTIADYQGQATIKQVDVAVSYRAGRGATRTIRMTTLIGAGGISG